MRHALLVVGLLLASPAARAACDQPAVAGDLARLLTTADLAFADLDADAFRAALAEVRRGIPCLGERLPAGEAASYHRAEAFQAFLDRDHALAVQHFQAMLGASPGIQLPEDYAPEGHPLRTDFEIAEGLPAVATRALAWPEGARVYVDGREAREAPTTLPFVLQVVQEDGAVGLSTLVEVGAALPLAVAPATTSSRAEPASASRDRRKLGPPLVATAAVAAAASASLYGMSVAREDAFWDPATPDADLDELRRQANTMASVSLGAGIVAVGATTAAVITFAW